MFQHQYESPVIILSAPRAGSTLLFEVLANSSDLITIGDESHGVFETNPKFNPLTGQCFSNELTADDATPEVIDEIRRRFFTKLCQRYAGYPNSQEEKRLLEKTPKNALRIPFLKKIFPGAKFIYLYRNPRENISSIMDGWQSGKFVTYGRIVNRSDNMRWSYLLPKGWQNYNHKSLVETAAFQWQVANQAVVDELNQMDTSHWLAISYQQLSKDTQQTLKIISDFCELSDRDELSNFAKDQLKLSRYTLTPPAENKWHKNAELLSQVIPDLSTTVSAIAALCPTLPVAEFDLKL